MTNYEERKERPILLLVDRSIDPCSPIMYELHYQAMVYDLLDVSLDNVIK